MKKPNLFLYCLFVCSFLVGGCEREIEDPVLETGLDYFSLLIGNYWVYEVDELVYFGENDSEENQFYYRDQIRSVYVNASQEQVFIVERERSEELVGANWELEFKYTLVVRDGSLVRTIQNQPLIILSSLVDEGAVWNGNLYRNADEDEFRVSREGADVVRVLQENEDDEITFRDIRYEVYQKSVGMTELYSEVLTYCSRNDCLGNQLVDSGTKIEMKLIDHGME